MVTNSDRTISRQRPFLPAPGEARADWRIICDVARAMEFSGFDFVSPHEIFREHVRLTAHANDGRRALNLGAWSDITATEYRNWQPAAWPMSGSRESARGPMFADGRFMHADGRARFIALTPRGPEHPPTRDFPLVLNTGRVRDHWHTMTRTGKSARLSAHIAEPFAEVNAADALRFAVRDGALAPLRSAWGSMVVRVRTGGEVPPGMVFAPIHWNGPSLPTRALARWSTRWSIRFPASPSSNTRPLPSSLSWRTGMACCSRVRRCRRRTPPGGRACRASSSCATSSPAGICGLVARGRLCWACLESASTSTGSNITIRRGTVSRAPGSSTTGLKACLFVDSRPVSARSRLARGLFAAPSRAAARGSLLAGARCEGADQGAWCAPVSASATIRSPLARGSWARRPRRSDWQAPQVRHQLRLLRAGDPGHHCAGRGERSHAPEVVGPPSPRRALNCADKLGIVRRCPFRAGGFMKVLVYARCARCSPRRGSAQSLPVTVRSPDNPKVVLKLAQNGAGQLSYSIERNGETVIAPSALRLRLAEGDVSSVDARQANPRSIQQAHKLVATKAARRATIQRTHHRHRAALGRRAQRCTGSFARMTTALRSASSCRPMRA